MASSAGCSWCCTTNERSLIRHRPCPVLVSDLQAEMSVSLMRSNGATVEYLSIPDAPHILHTLDPDRYVDILTTWIASLP